MTNTQSNLGKTQATAKTEEGESRTQKWSSKTEEALRK